MKVGIPSKDHLVYDLLVYTEGFQLNSSLLEYTLGRH